MASGASIAMRTSIGLGLLGTRTMRETIHVKEVRDWLLR